MIRNGSDEYVTVKCNAIVDNQALKCPKTITRGFSILLDFAAFAGHFRGTVTVMRRLKPV